MRLAVFFRAALMLNLICCVLARADGLIVIHDGPSRPDHFAFAPLDVSYHRVEVDIDDRIALTKVDQEFVNSSNQRLEGTYLFPLPEGATIDKFSMDIDGTMTDAELLDAGKARSIYEEIVRKYRDPALLEYVGRGAMKVRIFPIEPNSKKRIQLRYTQVIKSDSSVMEYLYPLNTEKFSAKPLKDVSVKVRLNCSTPIKSIYSPTHDIDIRRDGELRAVVGFEQTDARPDIDFKLIVTREADPIGIELLTYRSGAGDGYFMLLASPGMDVSASQIQPKDICFVLDTSGSMAGPKLEQARKALLFCLANLNEGDRFEIIRFSTEAEPLFQSLREATKPNIESAYEFVNGLKPRGGTAISDALELARKTGHERSGGEARPYSVIFLTDGQPTVGTTNEDAIVAAQSKAERTNARIFPFGIGTDVNTTLLDRVASGTRGFPQYVLPSEDIEMKVTSFYTKIQSPVLSDVSFACDNPDIRLIQSYPAAMPDLFKGETLIAFGRYTLSGERRDVTAARITLSGMLSGSKRQVVSEVGFVGDDTRHGFIPRLWATRRVGWLLDEIRLRGESKELVEEVSQLAREHGIVTPYTAYLIMEDERKRNVPVATRTLQDFEQDRVAAETARGFYDSASASSGRLEKAGERAVTNATAIDTLKQGINVQQAEQAFGLARAITTDQPSLGYRAKTNYAQQVRVLNGRAFYQNGNTWTDSTAQQKQNLKRQEVKFNSEEYYVLLASNPQAAPWLSLGNEIDLVIDDTLYVVR